MKLRISPRRPEVVGFALGAALLGTAAAAYAATHAGSDATSPVPQPGQTTRPTAPGVSIELDQLGLHRLPLEAIAARVAVGQGLRIAPAGANAEWDSAFEPEARLGGGEVPRIQPDTTGLLRTNGAEFDFSPPAGWTISDQGATFKQTSAGDTIFVHGSSVLTEREGGRPVTIDYWRLKQGASLDVTAYQGSPAVWVLMDREIPFGVIQVLSPSQGFEAVLQADFVVNGVYFRIRSPGLNATDTVNFVKSIRGELN